MFKKSDLLLVEPTGYLAQRLVQIREHLQLAAELQILDSTLVPGQPLELKWRFHAGGAGADSSVLARIFVDGHLVREHASVPVTAAQKGTGWVDEHKITISDATVAGQVYRWGHRVLRLEIREGSSLYRTQAGFQVVPEPFALSGVRSDAWWWWQSLSTSAQQWKEPFEFVGDFVNRSKFARMTSVRIEMAEVLEDQNEPYVDPCTLVPLSGRTQSAVDVAPSGTSTFRFPYVYDWSWLSEVAGGFFVKGPMTRSFWYGFYITAIDQYGNVYEGCAPRLHRAGNVDHEKWAAGASAMLLTANAVAMAIAAAASSWTIVGGIGFGAAAAASLALAHEAADVALDPPEPDPNFREVVRLGRAPTRSWPAERGAPPFDAAFAMLEAGARLMSLERVRTTTRARLMGARAAGDDEWTRRHEQGYLAIVRELAETADRLDRLVPEAQAQVEAHPLIDAADWGLGLEALVREGIPRAVHDALREEPHRRELGELVELAQCRELSQLAKANGLSIAQLAMSFRRFVTAVESKTEAITAGETYVPPPPVHLQAVSYTNDSAVASQPRRRKNCCC
ncbi:MAG: hypothetical protein ACHP85_16195 [Burkholderiales bacterium]|jgi:hypothetical protein